MDLRIQSIAAAAKSISALNNDVAWHEQSLPGYPRVIDINGGEYLDVGYFDDPKQSFGIEGHEVSLLSNMSEIGRILEDDQNIYIY